MPTENVTQYVLKQVELMQSGVAANGTTFDNEALQGIADAFKVLGLDGRVPLKLGHDDKQPLTSGQPALGWCKNLRVVGDKLLGDFVDMPKVIYDAFKTGRYKQVSVELLKNVQAGTRIIPWVIDAVALLGATQPAFGSLKDLQSLTMARGNPPKHESRATFTMNRADDGISAEIQLRDLRLQNKALQNQLRESKFKTATEEAIKLGRVTRADVARFSSVVPLEGQTAEAWSTYAKGIEPTRLGPARRSAGDIVNGDDTGQFMTMRRAEVVTFLTEKDCLAHGGKVTCFSDLAAASSRVLRANKNLALQCFENPSALYEP